MVHDFKIGDHVEWNSEAGRVRGTIKKKHTAEVIFKGYTVHASKEGAAVFDKERYDRPPGYAQRFSSQNDRKGAINHDRKVNGWQRSRQYQLAHRIGHPSPSLRCLS